MYPVQNVNHVPVHSALSGLSSIDVRVRAQDFRGGRCGAGTGPAEEGGGGRNASADREEPSSPLSRCLFLRKKNAMLFYRVD